MINVTKTILPDKKIFDEYLNFIWHNGQLTNHGPLVNNLEQKLKEYFEVNHFFLVNNGTIALQIAIKALNLKGEIITTPFSYVATTSSIIWENCTPVFADIDPSSLTININEIEKKINSNTEAILATHVYGIPCKLNAIKEIAQKHKIKVIYDAAHAFGIKYDNIGILNYGDISTISFHATKLFHTIEGGGIATNNTDLAHKISYMRNFGHKGAEDFQGVGINAKVNEFSAAMGLSILPNIDSIINQRKSITEIYNNILFNNTKEIIQPYIDPSVKYNYSYYPIILKNESILIRLKEMLNKENIFPRRYFYPSLNTLKFLDNYFECPVSEDISSRVLCLPIYPDLTLDEIKKITNIILKYI